MSLIYAPIKLTKCLENMFYKIHILILPFVGKLKCLKMATHIHKYLNVLKLLLTTPHISNDPASFLLLLKN